MKNKFFSLQYKILIFSFVVILIPTLTIGIFSYKESVKIVQQKVSITNLNTVRQVGERIDFIFQDAHDMSLYLIQNDNVREFFKLENEDESLNSKIIGLNNSLMYLISSKPYINSLYFKGFNGISMDTRNATNPIDEETEREILRLKGGYIWKIGRIINYDGTSMNVFSLIRVVNDMYNIANRLAIMKINISEEDLSEIYSNKITGKQDDFFLVDENGTIVSSINKKRLGQSLDMKISDIGLYSSKEGYFQTRLDGQNYLITYYIIDNLNCRLINLMPLKELLKENEVIPEVTLCIVGASFFICILIALLFSIKVLSPLKKIRSQMKKVEDENFDVSIDLNGNDEIAMLGKSFNKMSARLKELINQVYLSRIKQKEAELTALQAQINPHFLYNTLDTIYWMGRMERAFETSRLVEALAKLFRLSLNSGKKFTLLRNEVEHLNNYLIIQKKRYGDSINFNIEVEDKLLDCKVVNLILQPLVENAINHGIDKKDGKGNILVSIRKEAGNVVYEIRDDGRGVDVDEINRLLRNTGDSNKGLGIKNVNDRIKLYFGEQYGIAFFSGKGGGTTVTVTQPYVRGGGNID